MTVFSLKALKPKCTGSTRPLSACWANHMALCPTTCKVPQNHNFFLHVNNLIDLSNCKQEIGYPRLFLSDDDDLVFCRTGSAKPPIDFIPPTLRGSRCALFSVLQQIAQRYISPDSFLSRTAHLYHTSLYLSHLTYSIRGAGSASGIVGSTPPPAFAQIVNNISYSRHSITTAKVNTRTSLHLSYYLLHYLYTI